MRRMQLRQRGFRKTPEEVAAPVPEVLEKETKAKETIVTKLKKAVKKK